MMYLQMPFRGASAPEAGLTAGELSALLDARCELAAILDLKGTIVLAGPRASELFGRPAQTLCGAELLPLIHPEDAAGFERQFRKALEGTGEGCPVHWRVRAEDGSWRGLAGSFYGLLGPDAVAGAMLTAQDAAGRRHRERQLRRAQRMAALGELTGGVAHEFSNLLSVILCYNDLALDAMEQDHPLRNELREMHSAAERGASLVSQLLSYGRRSGDVHRSVDLNHIVDDTVRMLSPVLDDRIRIRVELAPDLYMVNVDPAQFEQVLLNLALNARDAMPYGGVIRIATRNAESNGSAQEGLPPGQYAQLSFSDTGAGMEAATRKHIFEPFFTTKAGGHGSGLGLATVRSIVGQHGGVIAVESELDKGTTFHIYIPQFTPVPGAGTAA